MKQLTTKHDTYFSDNAAQGEGSLENKPDGRARFADMPCAGGYL